MPRRDGESATGAASRGRVQVAAGHGEHRGFMIPAELVAHHRADVTAMGAVAVIGDPIAFVIHRSQSVRPLPSWHRRLTTPYAASTRSLPAFLALYISASARSSAAADCSLARNGVTPAEKVMRPMGSSFSRNLK